MSSLALPAEELRRLVRLAGVDTPCCSVRPAGGEQSNAAVVLDESFVLKLYRQADPGPSLEAELLLALEQAGFASSARLRGVAEAASPEQGTLAIVTEFVPSRGDGWELTVASLAAGDPGWLPSRARALGALTGGMHAALASSRDPAIVPQEPGPHAVAELVAALERDLVSLSGTPASGRRDALRDLVRELGQAAGVPELVLRCHGDYHLGQVLWADRGEWVVIDLEGEPARSPAERRRRTFALHDVAGMLRSFAYAAAASSLHGGVPVPVGWEDSCRSAFLEGWRATVDPRLVPEDERACEGLLALCELRKLLYEVRYELSHRPDWVCIPVAGLERILEET